jgi:hypothetical protein
MSIIFTVVHELTGFIEASEIQPATAILGIKLHSGLIMVIAAMVFSFIPGVTSIIATLFVLGLGLGGFLTMMAPNVF